MNRKRKDNETFEKYRENLKKEAKELKQRLKGNLIWHSDFGTATKKYMNGVKYLSNENYRVQIR